MVDQLSERQQVNSANRNDRSSRDNEEQTHVRNCDCAKVTAGCVGDAAPLFETSNDIGLQALKN